jgi:hypothetical protein
MADESDGWREIETRQWSASRPRSYQTEAGKPPPPNTQPQREADRRRSDAVEGGKPPDEPPPPGKPN